MNFLLAEQFLLNGRCSVLQAPFWAALQGVWQLQQELPIAYVLLISCLILLFNINVHLLYLIQKCVLLVTAAKSAEKLTPELVNFLCIYLCTKLTNWKSTNHASYSLLSCFVMQTRSPSKAAGMFSGTQEKCATCGKTAYPLEKVKTGSSNFP